MASGLGKAWVSFRRWRRTRPFAAAVFAIVAASAITGPPVVSLNIGEILITISTLGGISSLLIGAVLLACAVGLVVRPELRNGCGYIMIVASLASLVTANLGGFFVGMLAGLVGGACAIGWAPGSRDRTEGAGGPPFSPATDDLHPDEAVVSEETLEPGETAEVAVVAAPVGKWRKPFRRRGSFKALTILAAVIVAGAAGLVRPVSAQVHESRGLLVSSRTSLLNSSRMSFSGMHYNGVGTVVTRNGSISVLMFKASSVSLDNPLLSIEGESTRMILSGRKMHITDPGGGVQILLTRIKGDVDASSLPDPDNLGDLINDVFGHPGDAWDALTGTVDFTPSSPPSVMAPEIAMDDVVANVAMMSGIVDISGVEIEATTRVHPR